MSLEFFFARLPQSTRDQIVSIVNEAAAEDSPSRIAALEEEIEGLRVKIDQKFHEREGLKTRAELLDRMLALVEREKEDLELAALRLWLTSLRERLRARVAKLHPEEDLRRKQELASERDATIARRHVVSALSSRLVLPASVPRKTTEAVS